MTESVSVLIMSHHCALYKTFVEGDLVEIQAILPCVQDIVQYVG